MALADFFSFSSPKPPEDQIGSSSSTPPGIQTPHPDPADKRLPGILSSYFGQVGSFHSPSANHLHRLPRTQMLYQKQHSQNHPQMSNNQASSRDSGELAAPLSPTMSIDEQEPISLLASSKEHPGGQVPSLLPTPPKSSPSSFDAIDQDGQQVSGTASSDGSPTNARSSFHAQPVLEAFAPTSRRQTGSAKPTTSTATELAVHAAHFSTPDPAFSSAKLCAATVLESNSSAFVPGTASSCADEKLTARDYQSTPPRTPRTLSQDSKPSRTSSPHPRATPTPKSSQQANIRKGSTSDAFVGAPRGKLFISIFAGRGLRPSTQPYVVCQFQWNEYISKGPRNDSLVVEDGKEVTNSGIPMTRRTDSDMGKPMAIPMKSRQSSQTSMSSRDSSRGNHVTDPVWNRDAVFDVVGDQSEIDISVYDHARQETFLGHVRFCPNLTEDTPSLDQWFKLEPRDASESHVTGEIHIKLEFQKTDKRHYRPEDFAILKLIGKGTFGQVFQVRKKDTQRIYAMKVLSKKIIVQKKEVAHTLGERNILVRTAMADSPFIVGLKFSFQTPTDLYLVTDYMSGGELFWHLQKEGRFQEGRAKFYIAELILALQHLHHHDIVYRDLKPENILLDANGHIALCDFGLSKANLTKDDTTNTFCGTTEYLAPEVLLDDQGYTKMVDFWSLGVLVFEMCCGWSPFYAEDTQQMYKNIAFGKVRFPRDALSNEGRNFVKGLLNRNPRHRLGALSDAEELKAHPFFEDVDWKALSNKNLVPPFKPRLKSELDTSNFDPEFTNALNGASSLNARAAALASGIDNATTPLSPTMQANFKGFTFVDESSIEKNVKDADAMDEDDDAPDWEYTAPPERMSGITRTVTGGHGGPEDGMFNGDGFDA